MASKIELRPAQRAYRPYGTAEEIFYRREPIVGLDGPAGTGKSRACLEKVHLCMEKYPGARALILRKTRESLSEAALFTFEAKVVPEGHPALTDVKRNFRQNYKYPNGSEIVVCGLDKPQKVMSTEYDIAYIQEAVECNEEDIELVTTRLRNGVMPYQQLIFDCNPDKPLHWINQRGLKGDIVLLHSKHEENPTLWDPERGEWTTAGAAYMATLERLTGARLQRLRYGKWVAAEGQIYTGWDSDVHLIDKFMPPPEWPRIWSVDFGFTHPFVWIAWAVDPDGRMYAYREIYYSRRLVSLHARTMLAATGWQRRDGRLMPISDQSDPLPRAIICDHDSGDRAILEDELGLPTIKAYKAVSAGLQAVADRLVVQPDSKPRIFIMRDILVETDPQLEEEKKPTCMAQEWDGYVWDPADAKVMRGDVPLKENDHGMDNVRYAVAYQDKLEDLKGKDIAQATPGVMRVVGIQRDSRGQAHIRELNPRRHRSEGELEKLREAAGGGRFRVIRRR